jgi:hypothetical protein
MKIANLQTSLIREDCIRNSSPKYSGLNENGRESEKEVIFTVSERDLIALSYKKCHAQE